MPSAVGIVDLTGSDDESTSGIATRTVSRTREPPGAKKGSQANPVKPSPTRASFSAPSQNSNGHLRNGGSSFDGSALGKAHSSNSKARSATTPLQGESQKVLERLGTTSQPRTPTYRDDTSTSQSIKPIVLSDDVLPERPVFRRPRTFDGDSSQKSSRDFVSSSARSSGPPAAQSNQSRKRQRDSDDLDNERESSTKKKLDRATVNAPGGPRVTFEELRKRQSAKRDRSPKKEGAVFGTIDLTGSPPRSTTGDADSVSAEERWRRSGSRPMSTSSFNGPGQSEAAGATSFDKELQRGRNEKSSFDEPPLNTGESGISLRGGSTMNDQRPPSKQRHDEESVPVLAKTPERQVSADPSESTDHDISTSRQRKPTARAIANGIKRARPASAKVSKKAPSPPSQPRTSQSRSTTQVNGLDKPESRRSASHSPSPSASGHDQYGNRTQRTNNIRNVKNGAESDGVNVPDNPATRELRSPSKRESPLRQSEPIKRAAGMATPRPVRRSSSPSSAAAADLQLRTEAMANHVEDDPPPCQTAADKFIMPTLAASAANSSLWAQIPLANRIEKVLGKYLEEMKEDNEYWAATLLQQSRLMEASSPAVPSSNVSFGSIRPIRFSTWQRKGSIADKEQLWKVERIGPSGKGLGVESVTAPYKAFETEARDVPSYAHYVGIRNNFLAPNVKLLHCWPYFGDDFDVASAENLNEQYELDIANREEKLLLLQQAQKYEPYLDSVLRDLDCTWVDVLRYLIEEQPKREATRGKTLSREDAQRQALHNFSSTSSRSIAILKELPPSTPEKMDHMEILNERFEKMAKLSLWHVARRSADARSAAQDADDASDFDEDVTCRLCLRFNCPYHGELNERGDDDSDEESSLDRLVATDIVNPLKVDQRDHVSVPIPSSPPIPVDFRTKSNKKDAGFWRTAQLYTPPDERIPFHPCHHPGTSCDTAQCACFEENRPCEKSCGCSPGCNRRFQGCSCAKRGQRCFNDLDCPCFNASRECDPDLCGKCGVCEVVDPVNRHNEEILRGRCQNCYIQRGVPVQTLLGDSGIHGLGLYACENVREHDFVGEYKGEIITKEEAERRGAVYEIQKLSYLFSLNATQEIDSTYFGNKVRFINHASRQKANLYPRIMMVNTVHRIALYASKNITAGQELLFDYGPKFPDEQLGGKKQKKSAPHVRNANLVKSFVDVEESEDEVGNVRAKAVNRSAVGRGRPQKSKKRGRPRAQGGVEGEAVQGGGGRSTASSFQQAGERLAAFNISDDPLDDAMELDHEVGDDEEYRDDDEESEYDSEESEERQDSEDIDSGED